MDAPIKTGQIILHTTSELDVVAHSLVSKERAPGDRIRGFSDHRFLSLRHSWSSGNFFYFASGQTGRFDIILPRRVVEAIGNPQQDGGETSILFDVNDPFEWELPAEEDVASTEYWRRFQHQVEQYRSVGPTLSNVTLRRVSRGDRHGVALVATRPIPAGSELLLHYGLGWWVPKILGQVFLAVDTPSGLEQVRWVEAMANPRQSADPDGVLAPTARFPSLVTKCVTCRWKGGSRRIRVLWNTVSDDVATDEEVVAFVAWKSCVDPIFASSIANHFLSRSSNSVPSADAIVTSMRGVRRLLRNHISK